VGEQYLLYLYYIDYCRGNNENVILQWLLNFDVISIKLENGKKKNMEKMKKKKREDERERERKIKRRICVGE